MPTRFTLEPGDMIVFEDTNEICVLIKPFDVAERRTGKRSAFPKDAWDVQWTKEWKPAGPWQKFLSVPPQYVKSHGVSRLNLWNRLSFRGAVKKGKVIKVKKTP